MVSIKPIKQQKISDQVFDQLKELIFRGTFKPGDQLIPERDLAKKMNVSRTTIRNAINRLVTMGLIEQKQGQGTFVAVPDDKKQNPFAAAMKTQDASIYDLLEVRTGLECNAAGLAAKRADENDLKAMIKSMEEMEKQVSTGRRGSQADASFHMAIAFATKNALHIQVMKSFYDYLFYGIKESLTFLYEDPGNIGIILNQHKAIMTAIVNRDAQAAYDCMKEHINFILTFFKEREK